MADKLLLEGSFQEAPVVQSIGNLIASLKELEVQGTATSRTLQGMENSVMHLQRATDKPIAPSLNDGAIKNETEELRKEIERLNKEIQKGHDAQKKSYEDLGKEQGAYAKRIEDLSKEVIKNQKHYEGLVQKLGEAEEAYDELVRTIAGRATQEGYATSDQAVVDMEALEERGKAVEVLTEQTAQAAKTDEELQASIAETEKAMNANSRAMEVAAAKTRLLAAAKTALATAGTMIVVAVIGLLVKELIKWAMAATDAERQQAMLNEGLKAFTSGTAKATQEVDKMRLMFKLANDGVISQETALKEYNSTLGKTLGTQEDFNAAQQAFIDLSPDYIRMVGLRSQAEALATLRQQGLQKKAQLDLGLVDETPWWQKTLNFLAAGDVVKWSWSIDKGRQEYKNLSEISRKEFNKAASEEADKDIAVINAEWEKVMGELLTLEAKFADVRGDSKTKQGKVVENIYLRELEAIRDAILNYQAEILTTEALLRERLEREFIKRKEGLIEAFRRGQLTRAELISLAGEGGATEIGGFLAEQYELAINSTITSFTRQRDSFLRKITDEISRAHLDALASDTKLIEDELARQRVIIDQEYENAIADAQRNREERIREINESAIITPEEKTKLIGEIEDAFNELVAAIGRTRERSLQNLAEATFQNLVSRLRAEAGEVDLGISEQFNEELQILTQFYLSGQISYEAYQKQLTEITRRESKTRLDIEAQSVRDQIALYQSRLAAEGLTEAERGKLERDIITLRQRLATIERQQMGLVVSEEHENQQKRLAWLQEYVEAVATVADAIIGIWQQANDAEMASINESLRMQERRVDAARRLAELGNAEYLKMEEEREQKLLIQRENAARRQLAINAALQASQLMVAITGAVSKLANPEIGVAEAIASIGVIIGSIATGYALVKSLQDNQPSFFHGTEDTGRGGNVDNRGGFWAILHPRERVINAEDNKKLKGISNRELIERVNRQEVFVPELDYNRIQAAAELSLASSDKIYTALKDNERKLDENTMVQRDILRAIRGMGVNVNVDRDGLAVSVLETIDHIHKLRNS